MSISPTRVAESVLLVGTTVCATLTIFAWNLTGSAAAVLEPTTVALLNLGFCGLFGTYLFTKKMKSLPVRLDPVPVPQLPSNAVR